MSWRDLVTEPQIERLGQCRDDYEDLLDSLEREVSIPGRKPGQDNKDVMTGWLIILVQREYLRKDLANHFRHAFGLHREFPAFVPEVKRL